MISPFRKILFVLFLLFSGSGVYSQGKNMGIGTNAPHPSAIVHLGDGESKGFKIPYTDTNAVIAYANSFTPPMPIANGLLIFQKGAETFYYYDAPKNKWIPLSGITGPTGPKGPTGIPGITGRVGYGSEFRSGNGFPTSLPSDTCGSYYIDLVSSNVYKFNCPGGWIYLAGPFKGKIVGGETVHLSTQSNQIASETAQNTTIMTPINNLVYTVVAPSGYKALAWIHAYGAVRKTQVNDEYNYAKFDIYVGSPAISANKWQVVSMGPTGQGPDFHQDLVSWSLSFAMDMGNGKRIEIFGAQKVGTKTGLGSIVLAGAPGTPEQAHLEIMVMYMKN